MARPRNLTVFRPTLYNIDSLRAEGIQCYTNIVSSARPADAAAAVCRCTAGVSVQAVHGVLPRAGAGRFAPKPRRRAPVFSCNFLFCHKFAEFEVYKAAPSRL